MVAPTSEVGVRGLHAAAAAPGIDAERAFVEVSSGAYRLEAPLTFATVPSLRRAGLSRIAAAQSGLSIDLQQVALSDSAGLALLIDWLAEARKLQRTLHYEHVPEALRVLAGLSDVESLIVAAQ
ncbi:MAG: STAS domain-containing protein [Steroidobacteraceae bacterium]|jgi:phospholipid transport system transporter-binding protein